MINLPNIDLQKRLPIIIGVVLAFVSVIIANSYIRQREQELIEIARRQAEKQLAIEKVLVASQDIDKGARIEANMVEYAEIPVDYIQPRATDSTERIVDKITLAPIARGEQILLNKLGVPEEIRDTGSLSFRTPPGKRAILIPVDNISSVGGMIKPSDHVDILGVIPQTQEVEGQTVTQNITVPLFQNVLVLAVGQETESTRTGSKSAGEVNSITVALFPQEAIIVAFVQEQGRLRFTLRSPADKEIVAVQPADWNALFNLLFPDMIRQLQAQPLKLEDDKKEEAQIKIDSAPEVEIYRGTKKEVVPLLY
ncbi:MAG: Flp pilus assembly protein CpaB [Candidatus Omnitrophica bacterium CG11_big_fil_rev_8_21_14_0_20_42_13]|uniref:Flp pilus assembly protein CpaB n=1 Tax=Candidatus Ghiorseimicrobium undicola TaxID=1974746 RepID=A0A2H0LWY5_9BACT|nr:MAG: Flp pilus assembly protein CpaB [Candidatus Omnitrophica bacterium CG11_big_fil_rev_8_21_14_0_20_42_13]